MSEPKLRLDRRRVNVPGTWPSRQQVANELGLGDQTLNRYIEQMTALHNEHYRNLGSGRPAYLSPELVAEIRKLHEAHLAVESLDQAPGYFDRQTSVGRIGCGEGTFYRLLTELPPVNGDMRLLRNRNNEKHPAYSETYLDRLKVLYEQDHRPDYNATRSNPKPGSFKRGDVVNRPADLLAGGSTQRPETSEPQLVQLTAAERQAALTNVTTLIQQLDVIHDKHLRDEKYDGLKRQLNMASTELASTRPIPQGLESLLEQTRQYLPK